MGYLQKLSNNRAEIIPGQIIDNRMKDEVEIILIVTGMASTPLESLSTQPVLRKAPAEKEKMPVSVKSYRSIKEIHAESVIEEETEVLEPAYAAMESVKTAEGKIEPSPSPVKLEVSAAAEAAFETFMSPLGLSGYTPAPVTIPNEPSDTDKLQDLDIPTFIRRKM